MSYDVFVDNKNSGQIASNHGWHTTTDWLIANADKDGEAYNLGRYGVSVKPDALRKELEILQPSAPANIKSILADLEAYALTGEDHVGVSQEGMTAEALSEPRRKLRPEEHKHDFQGHVERQDSTAVAIRRILGSVKDSLVRDAAKKAAAYRPEHLDDLKLTFDKNLQARIAQSLGIAHQYGYDQVYAERYRATGRSKKEPILRALMTEVEALTKRRLHYRVRRHGMEISIENAAGSVRTARDGSWQTKMKHPYGYIRGTHGHDGEQIDAYVGPYAKATHIYIVRQNDPVTGEFDEDKVFIGFQSEQAVREAYLAHRDDGDRALGSIVTMTVDEFRNALDRNEGSLHYKPLQTAVSQALAEKSAAQDKPSLIAETTVSDLNNWITGRTRGAHIDAYKTGQRDQELEDSIVDDILEGSDAFLDRIADEAARSGVAGGRYSALEELADEIDHYVRSEAMDQNTCDPCEEGDGDEWDSLDDVDWSPGDDCEGKDNCRGQLMPVFADEGTVELLGGPGSGNYGHAGRKGEVGGSAPGGAGRGTRENPIQTSDINKAIALIAQGKIVELPDAEHIHTMLNKLAEVAKSAKPGKNYNLCNVQLPGSSLFCSENVGIPRLNMPQFSGHPVSGSKADSLPRDKNGEVDAAKAFMAHLARENINVTQTEVPASYLRASQNELVGAKVAGMMGSKSLDLEHTPIFVSRDNYVVDGHHRWAALIGRASESTDKYENTKMAVLKIDMPISAILHEANRWTKEFGIQPKSGK